MSNVAISANTITCNYAATANAVIFASPTTTANLTLNVQNVPVPSTNFGTFSLSVFLPVSTYKVYVSNIIVNSTSVVPISSGGFSNITINQNATHTLQQFNIMFIGGPTPIVITNLVSLF
jgi:hypothetical protein